MLNNIRLTNTPIAVGVKNGATVLPGGTLTIDSWVQGNVFKGTNGNPTFTQGNIASIPKASSLLDGSGRIVGRGHPQYADYAPGDFVSVRSHGAKGDGQTDDTQALKNIFAQVRLLLSEQDYGPDTHLYHSLLAARSSSSMPVYML